MFRVTWYDPATDKLDSAAVSLFFRDKLVVALEARGCEVEVVELTDPLDGVRDMLRPGWSECEGAR